MAPELVEGPHRAGFNKRRPELVEGLSPHTGPLPLHSLL